MTDKEQIIIDGVDVAGCKYFNRFRNICHNKNLCCDCEKNQDCYFKQLARKTKECEELKKGYAELTKIVSPYMDDFTGYNEELGGFDPILCVKELFQQLAHKMQENEELKEYAQRQENQRETYYKEFLKLSQENKELKRKVELMMDCPDCKVDEYKKALEEIERICLEDVHIFADGTELRYDSLDDILDIINKLKGGNNV